MNGYNIYTAAVELERVIVMARPHDLYIYIYYTLCTIHTVFAYSCVRRVSYRGMIERNVRQSRVRYPRKRGRLYVQLSYVDSESG